jgi:uncharacterized protein YihD (DUF1040 family)
MGRNPDRIDKILSVIRTVWHQNPDLRLGQLLLNCFDPNQDIYNVEDDVIIDRLIDVYLNNFDKIIVRNKLKKRKKKR